MFRSFAHTFFRSVFEIICETTESKSGVHFGHRSGSQQTPPEGLAMEGNRTHSIGNVHHPPWKNEWRGDWMGERRAVGGSGGLGRRAGLRPRHLPSTPKWRPCRLLGSFPKGTTPMATTPLARFRQTNRTHPLGGKKAGPSLLRANYWGVNTLIQHK